MPERDETLLTPASLRAECCHEQLGSEKRRNRRIQNKRDRIAFDYALTFRHCSCIHLYIFNTKRATLPNLGGVGWPISHLQINS